MTVVLLKISCILITRVDRNCELGHRLHLPMHITGKLHVVIVHDQIRPLILRSASEIYILIHTVGIGKVSYQWKTYGLVYPIHITLSCVSRRSGQGVFFIRLFHKQWCIFFFCIYLFLS